MTEYNEFISTKVVTAHSSGFQITYRKSQSLKHLILLLQVQFQRLMNAL